MKPLTREELPVHKAREVLLSVIAEAKSDVKRGGPAGDRARAWIEGGEWFVTYCEGLDLNVNETRAACLGQKKETNEMSNLDHVSPKLMLRVQAILDDPATHSFTRQIIAEGLNRDCVDAVHDSHWAYIILKAVCDEVLFEYESTTVQPEGKGV